MQYTKEKCGCECVLEGDIYTRRIKYCPLHRAAPELYEALIGLCKSYDVEISLDAENLEYYGNDWRAAIRTIAKIKGGK